VEAGRSVLAMGDIENLEIEDIILLEETDLVMSNGALEGQVPCRVGDGAHGVVQGQLAVGTTGKYEVQIENIVPIQEPEADSLEDDDEEDEDDDEDYEDDDEEYEDDEEGEMSDATHTPKDDADAVAIAARLADALNHDRMQSALNHPAGVLGEKKHPAGLGADAQGPEWGAEHSDDDSEEEYDEDDEEYEEDDEDDDEEYEDDDEDEGGGGSDDNLEQTAGLLGDVNVPLVVELGRVKVSANDVARLRAGQVIELSRVPGDPVDLVISGKRIGKGELVEIDGELGVRVLSLLK
jgi:flagellar motor switch protein FliN